MRSTLSLLSALALASALGGCGSDSPTTNPSAPRAGSGGSAGKTQGGAGSAGKAQGGAGGSAAGGSGPGGSGGSTAGQGGAGGSLAPSPLASIPGHGELLQDTSPKEGPRLMPAEVYIRSFLQAFGGLAPTDMQAKFKALDGALFDTWNDYLVVLGMPDLRVDVPRAPQPNTLMVATFERVGVALCDLAVHNDLKGTLPADKRVVFAFDLPKEALSEATFAPRFDVLHRTFLGYPAKLSLSTKRQQRFFDIYSKTAAAHKAADAPKAMSPEEAGWAAVCYGLVRHPEFHYY